MKEGREYKGVLLPVELYSKIEEKVKATGFSSIDEYIVFILEEVIKEDGNEEERALSKEEEAEIKKRLKKLGYQE